MQAQKTGAATPSPVVQALPNPFGNANLPQNGTLTTLLFPPYKIQAINSLFSNLAIWYLAINKTLFKAISENTLGLINILKRLTDYTLDRDKIKVLKISNLLAVDVLKEDALISEVKGPSHLLRCFLVSHTILLHFILSAIRYDLTISLHAYINRLLGFTMPYTWELVKSFQFIFHKPWMLEGIADSLG